jgi:hypothetical protein
MTAYSSTDGPVEILFDGSVIGNLSMTIPSGTHNFTNTVTFKGNFDAESNNAVIALVQTGAVINGLTRIKDSVVLTTAATSGDSPITINSSTTNNDGLIIENGGALFNSSSSVPLIDVDGEDYTIRLNFFSTLISFTANGVINIQNGGSVDLNCFNGCSLTSNVFVGTSGDLTINQDANCNVTDNSGSFSGTITNNYLDGASVIEIDDSNLSFTSSDVQDAIEQIDPGDYRSRDSFTSGDLTGTPADTLAIAHGLGEQYVDLMIFNNSDQRVSLFTSTMNNANTATVVLDGSLVPISGTWNYFVHK